MCSVLHAVSMSTTRSALKSNAARKTTTMVDRANALIKISRRVAKKSAAIEYGAPAAFVYNPVEYAAKAHEAYLKKFGGRAKRVVLVGMNPGPWGMAQTGVPFGDVEIVREWMGIETEVKRPKNEHPRVEIKGFASTRREGSGKRLWGWAANRGSASEFFKQFFVWNYVPLCFLNEKGTNLIPEKLPKENRVELYKICNKGLADAISVLNPRTVIGVGNFAKKRIDEIADGSYDVEKLLHPSPANPRANAGWTDEANRVLGAF